MKRVVNVELATTVIQEVVQEALRAVDRTVDHKAIEAAVHRAVQEALVSHLHPRTRLTIAEAAASCGVSKPKIYEAIKSGELQAHRLGGAGDYGVGVAELRRWALGEGLGK